MTRRRFRTLLLASAALTMLPTLGRPLQAQEAEPSAGAVLELPTVDVQATA